MGAGHASGPGSRLAVVTGGGSGMGRAICHHLARLGHRVAVVDVDGDASGQVAKEVEADGGRAVSAPVDVSDRAAVDSALDRARRELGGPVGIMVTSLSAPNPARLEWSPHFWWL